MENKDDRIKTLERLLKQWQRFHEVPDELLDLEMLDNLGKLKKETERIVGKVENMREVIAILEKES